MDIHHYVNVHNTHMADGVAQFHGHRLSAFSLSCILTIITSSHNITQVIKTCVTNDAWSQAQLGLKFGGLGLRSLSHHAAAAFIASLSFCGFGKADNIHLKQAGQCLTLRSPPLMPLQSILLWSLPFTRRSCQD